MIMVCQLDNDHIRFAKSPFINPLHITNYLASSGLPEIPEDSIKSLDRSQTHGHI